MPPVSRCCRCSMTPRPYREVPNAGGRFAPDLRHADLGRALAARIQGALRPGNRGTRRTYPRSARTRSIRCIPGRRRRGSDSKRGDPEVIVGWNVTTTAPTPAQTEGVLANEIWPYFDTYNIHTYDWSHSYAQLWKPAREAVSGRPLWVTEADRGTPHLKQGGPWHDQDPRFERLKVEWLAQSYARQPVRRHPTPFPLHSRPRAQWRSSSASCART